MATITKKKDKWYVQIRRSFHKPIYKSFIAKADALRWSRETERLIEVGEFLDTTEANKTIKVDQELTTEIDLNDRAINDLYIKKGNSKDFNFFKTT